MRHRIEYLKDVVGNNYLGIKFQSGEIAKFLEQLKEFISAEEFEIYTQNQQKRDSGWYHLTVINVADFNNLSKTLGTDKFLNSLDKVFDLEITDLNLLGLGTTTKNENRAYFVVCNSNQLKMVRDMYELPEHDFHITLGFKWKDVFGVRKNIVLQGQSKFLKVLRSEFLKKENFNFVKQIKNFTENPECEIIPLSISDNFLKVQCGDSIMDIGLLEGENKLFIFTLYKKSREVSRLPLTEIIRILQ
jgi:hypothetical protein